MEITLNKKKFRYFLNVFLFENRKEDKRADFFSITDQYIWRRDEHKLIAYRFDEKVGGNYNYSIEQINEVRRVEKLTIYEEGIIELEERKEIKKIYPDTEIPLEPNSLKLLSIQKWDTIFQIPSDFLTKQLSLAQNRLNSVGKDIETAEINIDIENFEFSIEGEVKKQMPLVLMQKEKNKPIYYSFSDFKDVLINAIQFDKMIEFKVKYPYFTMVKLNEQIFAILTHKKGKSFSG